ncbi:MAG: GxGYxYP domain-containing protein [Limisphaerales bacterium]
MPANPSFWWRWFSALFGFGLVVSTHAAPARAGQVFTFDARPLQSLDVRQPASARRIWDTMHLMTAMQGLANREAARFYVFYCDEFGVETDRFWFDWFRGEGDWLKSAEVKPLKDLEAVLREFHDAFEGLVVYDERVPATSNLASTAAGVERLLPVRWDPAADSVFTRLTRDLGIPVKLWLVNPDGTAKFTGRGSIPDLEVPSSGSAKVDAYRWAMARWLRPGLCGPAVAAYYLDAFWLQRPAHSRPDMHTLSNHDWFIGRRAFFFDLSPWGDEPPVDEPGQPVGADKRCLLDILRLLHDQAGGGIVKLGGFPPWPYKYTSHAGAGKHEPVPTEWEFTRLISQFNTYKEADAAGLGAMANASFFTHYPLRNRYPQPAARPTREQWRERGYVDAEGRVAPRFFVGHYVGDYDAPSWLYKAVPKFFNDPSRGQVPLGWAFDPNLADRAPQAFVYAWQHASTNDFFIAGDSGAGYLNPRALTVRPDSGLPSGLAAWERYCTGHYRRWDLTITGFVLDGAAGASTDLEFAAYQRFSPDGCGTHFDPGPAVRAGVPTCPERDLPDGVTEAVRVIASHAQRAGGQPGFLWARSILKSPKWYADVSRGLRENHPELPIEVVDPYTFFGLIRLQFGGREGER